MKPIIDPSTWAAVQAQLRPTPKVHGPVGVVLQPKRICWRDCCSRRAATGSSRLTPTRARGGIATMSRTLEAHKTPRRLAAAEIETATVSALRLYLLDHQQLIQDLGEVSAEQVPEAIRQAQGLADMLKDRLSELQSQNIRDLIFRVRYCDTQLELELLRGKLKQMLNVRDTDDTNWSSNVDPNNDVVTHRAPVSIQRRGPKMKMVVIGQDNAPIDLTLIAAIVKARGWGERLTSGDVSSIAEIAAEEQIGASYVGATLPLAYLAPQIVEEILSGRRSRDPLVRYPGKAPVDPSWRQQLEL